MKNQNNISNLKKLGLTAFASLIMSAAMIQAEGLETSASVSLNIFMNAQAHTIMYKVPVINEAAEVAAAEMSLENFVKDSEASLIYRAPESVEIIDVNAVVDDLESFTASQESSLRYNANESAEMNDQNENEVMTATR